MSLSARVAALASRIGTEFKATEVDLSPYFLAGFTGNMWLRMRGSSIAILTAQVRRSSGGALGTSASSTDFALLPASLRSVSVVSTAGRTTAPGKGFSSGSILLNSSGALTIFGQRSDDTEIIFGFAYLLA